jgi:hypothetical protein
MATKLQPVLSNELIVRVWRNAKGVSAYLRTKDTRVAAILSAGFAELTCGINASSSYRNVIFRFTRQAATVEELKAGLTCKIVLSAYNEVPALPGSTLMQSILSALSAKVLEVVRSSVPIVMEQRFRIE